jgi:hypothetical protein
VSGFEHGVEPGASGADIPGTAGSLADETTDPIELM